MRKLAVALTTGLLLSVTAVVPAFADTVTYTKTVGTRTFTCTVTYTDTDGSGTLTVRDVVTAVTCTRA